MSSAGANCAQDGSAEPAAAVSATPAPQIVALCIPTYRRNELLRTCLDAVDRLRLPAGCTLLVLVADNDADGGARGVCSARTGPFPPRYLVESRRGLCSARNRLLEEALGTGATFIAFIDDDEQPHPEWLARHLAALAGAADVSTGPVIQRAPEADDAAVAPGAAPVTPRFVACNNVVFRRRLAAEQGLRFDPQFNFTGGEDFDFFESSRRLGNRHVWTGAAPVYEPLTPERSTPGYLFRRHLTGAMTRVMQERKWRPGPGVWPRFILKVLGKLLGAGACFVRATFPPRTPAARAGIKRLASALGYLCGLLHVRVERYR